MVRGPALAANVVLRYNLRGTFAWSIWVSIRLNQISLRTGSDRTSDTSAQEVRHNSHTSIPVRGPCVALCSVGEQIVDECLPYGRPKETPENATHSTGLRLTTEFEGGGPVHACFFPSLVDCFSVVRSEVERAATGDTQVEDDQLSLSMHFPPLDQSRPSLFHHLQMRGRGGSAAVSWQVPLQSRTPYSSYSLPSWPICFPVIPSSTNCIPSHSHLRPVYI